MLSKYVYYIKLLIVTAIAFLNSQAYSSNIDTLIPETKQQISYSFSPIIKKTAPAVVNIYAQRRVRVSTSPFMNDPFFAQFFNNDMFQHQTKERLQNSLGSGVIISEEGIIVTNYHVIENAEDISIVLDGKDYKAQIIVKDKAHDLALLRSLDLAKEKNFKFLELGDSDNIEVGDLVLAIGNPYGIGKSVTSGIISGPDKQFGNKMGDYFLQTDAAINPGNSGGALINMRSELIGINTSIYTQSGGSQGLGFAIPSNIVKSFLKNVDLKQGKLIKPWSGLKLIDMDAAIKEALDLKQPGVIVKAIQPKSTFAKAGIQVGDAIIKIDSEFIISAANFEHKLYTSDINKKLTIEYLRDKKIYHADVVLETAPQKPLPEYTKITSKSLLQGAQLANLSPALSEELDIDCETIANIAKQYSNIIVINIVDNGSIAASYGLKAGDILIDYNGSKITSISQVQNVLKNIQGHHSMTIVRNNQIIKITG